MSDEDRSIARSIVIPANNRTMVLEVYDSGEARIELVTRSKHVAFWLTPKDRAKLHRFLTPEA